jgi:hypothetical protein
VAVDIEQDLAVLALEDDVLAPDLVEQGRRTLSRRRDDRLLAPRGRGLVKFGVVDVGRS